MALLLQPQPPTTDFHTQKMRGQQARKGKFDWRFTRSASEL